MVRSFATIGRMAKKSNRTKKRVAGRWPFIALVSGLALLALATALAVGVSQQEDNTQLLAKLPKDATVAGVGSLKSGDFDALRQLSGSTGISADQTKGLLDTVAAGGVTREKLDKAFKKEFAFAATSRGGLAILTVRDANATTILQNELNAQLENVQSVQKEDLTIRQGTVKTSGMPVAVAQQGTTVYLANGPDLISAAENESAGFSTLDSFSDVARRLPSGQDAYLFFNPDKAKEKIGVAVPLFGVALHRTEVGYDVSLQTADTETFGERLVKTSGEALPPADKATASVEGRKILDYLHLLEAQRQENSLPKVLTLRNGITNLSRQLGQDLESDYLAAADGHFVYSRFGGASGEEWMAAAGFPDAATAQRKTTELENALAAKVTIPVRKQVVTVLPDGTQSREVVSEGRGPFTFTAVPIGSLNASSVGLPGGLGTVYFAVYDKYFVLSNSQDGLTRMTASLAQPADVRSSGDLAVRLKLVNLKDIQQKPDSLSDWVFATRPARGTFKLDKASGVLEGTVDFEHGT